MYKSWYTLYGPGIYIYMYVYIRGIKYTVVEFIKVHKEYTFDTNGAPYITTYSCCCLRYYCMASVHEFHSVDVFCVM